MIEVGVTLPAVGVFADLTDQTMLLVAFARAAEDGASRALP
jgi:hypothetical protein